MSTHNNRYYEEHVTDGEPADRHHTSTRRYPAQTATQRPPTQRLQNEPVPARVPARTRRTTGDVVSRYEDDDDGDTYDTGDFYNPYDPPTERESQLRSRRVPSRSGNTGTNTGQTEPVRRVVPQYVDEYVERTERPVRRVRADVQRRPVSEEKLKTDQQARRTFIGRGLAILAGVGTIAMIGINVDGYVQASVDQYNHQMEEGNHGFVSLADVFGHGDSEENPTEIDAFIQENGIVSVLERPGGGSKTIRTDATRVSSSSPSGNDYSHVDLQLFKEKVGKKYRIRLQVKVMPTTTLNKSNPYNFFLVDNGKGYFELQK